MFFIVVLLSQPRIKIFSLRSFPAINIIKALINQYSKIYIADKETSSARSEIN